VKKNPTLFWKSFVGVQKCVRGAEQMLRVSTGTMIK